MRLARQSRGFFHLTANVSYPLMVLLSTMLLPVMIVRFQQGWFQMLLIDLPLFLASTCSISSFYLVAQKRACPQDLAAHVFYLPFVMATGIGISVRNAQAVLEAIVERKANSRARQNSISKQAGHFHEKILQEQSRLAALREILLGLYFSMTVVYAIINENMRPCRFCCSLSGVSLPPLHVARPNLLRAVALRRQRSPKMRPATSGAPGFLIIFAPRRDAACTGKMCCEVEFPGNTCLPKWRY